MSQISDYLGAKLLIEWDASQLVLSNNTAITTWATSSGESISFTGNGTYYTSPDGDSKPAVRVTTFQRMSCTPVSSVPYWLFVYKFFSGAISFYRLGSSGTTFIAAESGTTISFNHSTSGTNRSIAETASIRRAICGVTDHAAAIAGLAGSTQSRIDTAAIGNVLDGQFVIGGNHVGGSLGDVQVHHVIGCSALTQIEIQQSLALLREQWGIAGGASITGGSSRPSSPFLSQVIG